MASNSELFEQLKSNAISDNDLILSLQSENFRIVSMAMSRLIERNFYDDIAIRRLEELSQLLANNKFVGPWQFGHFAIATLALLDDEKYKNKFNKIFNKLSENDKFLVNNFIKAEAYKL